MNYIGEYVAARVEEVPDRQRCSPTSPLAFEGHYVGHNPGAREFAGQAQPLRRLLMLTVSVTKLVGLKWQLRGGLDGHVNREQKLWIYR
jgi:hypothetical protein